jgi:hypothetical protein
LLNKCLAPVVAVRVDPAAVVPEVVADVGRAVHLRVALMAAPMVDPVDRLALLIARHLHRPRAEASNVCLLAKSFRFNPTEEWFSLAQLAPTETGNAGVSSATLPHFSHSCTKICRVGRSGAIRFHSKTNFTAVRTHQSS